MRHTLLTAACLLILSPMTSWAQAPNINLSDLLSFDGEPSIAVNPIDGSNVIAGWMRLRIDGRIWIAVRSSFDGGATWQPIQFMPHMEDGYGSADVSIAFDRSGTAYLLYIDFRLEPDTVGGLYLTNSSDGGRNWSTPVEVLNTIGRPDLPLDRPWIAVDNSGGPHDGTIYVTSMSAYWHTEEHHIYVRSSTDMGTTWTSVRQVDTEEFSTGLVMKSYGAPSVGADGRLYIVYLSYDTAASAFLRLYAAVTDDAGLTWQRSVVSTVWLLPSEYGYAQGYVIAADPVRAGHAAVFWIDERLGDGDVFMNETTDGGLTWGNYIRINSDPAGNGIEQDLVWAQYSASGRLAVAWRDRRLSVPGASTPFDIYARISHDGGDSFEADERLSTESSPWVTLGCCNSFLGVALTDETLYSVWSDLRSNDWEVYFQSSSIVSGVENAGNTAPQSIILESNHPNPFSGHTWISYVLPGAGFTTLNVYDMLGRHIATLTNEWKGAGHHEVRFEASSIPAGMYVCILQSDGVAAARSILVTRRR